MGQNFMGFSLVRDDRPHTCGLGSGWQENSPFIGWFYGSGRERLVFTGLRKLPECLSCFCQVFFTTPIWFTFSVV
ncbi:hypothetical protein VTL71DRAFT_9928 [Oculimacula yallundae]|uniref:Uncharacterized protein n=1 Tax=Oculimacula yallundae TaxID=86028 RepID=A0ABR4BSN0_9HELO